MEEKDVQLLFCFDFKLAVLAEQGPASVKLWRYQFSKQSKAFPKCQKLENMPLLEKRLRELH